MRLKVLYADAWKVVAPMDAAGGCELEALLAAMAQDPKRRAVATGLYALWERIAPFGPKSLGTALYHCVDSKHGIYEFIKGDFRVLCFEEQGALVVCSHIFRKASQKNAEARGHARTCSAAGLSARVGARRHRTGEHRRG